MTILLILIPVTLLVMGIAIALFFWAVNHQQFDDLEASAILPLLEDAPLESAPAVQSLPTTECNADLDQPASTPPVP